MGSWIRRRSSHIIVVYASFLVSDVACRWWGSKPLLSSVNNTFVEKFNLCMREKQCNLPFCIFWMKMFWQKIKIIMIMYCIILLQKHNSILCHQFLFICCHVMCLVVIELTILLIILLVFHEAFEIRIHTYMKHNSNFQ